MICPVCGEKMIAVMDPGNLSRPSHVALCRRCGWVNPPRDGQAFLDALREAKRHWKSHTAQAV